MPQSGLGTQVETRELRRYNQAFVRKFGVSSLGDDCREVIRGGWCRNCWLRLGWWAARRQGGNEPRRHYDSGAW
jgi:hypothetical protein